jgi:hypothetical protein
VTAPEIPAAARALVRQLEGWSVEGPTLGTGSWAFGGLSEATDGNGKRKRIEVVEKTEAVLVRARHVDGRALVAIWARRASRPGWSLDMAWRGRRPDENTPRQLTATELKAYVAGPTTESEAAA